ncbi:multiubiquitin [Aquimarina sp. MAR_2010_214]|uniref:multiubiquitin domain-containing protein n=1 Tax=Aquimarina sp. MAR_2010_214 TaxID=1250026 RepID=UPI000CB49300|nr:multiubiquitin domain-containing protein [Aquimarina sp. MAR_2010_214]PKV49212.1 multiubiquitin [Aquimarina sp. MAR_2010_214]
MSIQKTDLRKCFCSGVKPAIAYEYIFDINEGRYSSKEQVITGNTLHELAGTDPNTHFIRMVTNKGKTLVGPDIKIDLTECGIERFIIRPYKQETIDLENCFCEGVKPIITYKYLIKINGKKYIIEKEKITGREILELVDKDPKNYRLRMFTKNGKVIVKPDDVIDVTECGVERFVCEPLDCTEGFIQKTDFDIPADDSEFLNSLSNKVDILKEGNVCWIMLRDYALPEGYNVNTADVAIMIPPHYPRTALDMVYFTPPLHRKDGKQIGQLVNQSIEGKNYQRWSRHRTQYNPWHPEIDNFESHLDLMMHCLIAEFNKR